MNKAGGGDTDNVDFATVEGFGQEWSHFDQSKLSEGEAEEIFDAYFSLFPWTSLPPAPVGFDLGCGSGRWARLVAPRVGLLHCIDASAAAVKAAMGTLSDRTNCEFHVASVATIPLQDRSMDFGYALGVLHHIPDTSGGIRACVTKLKPGAPFLLYIYYALDNRPPMFRALWRLSDLIRRGVSRLPHNWKVVVTTSLAILVYLPFAHLARTVERFGYPVSGLPLAAYRRRSVHTMRTDAYDRFATRLEKRFTRPEIANMMHEAGLDQISFRENPPYWCAVGYRRIT